MASTNANTLQGYQQPMWGQMDRTLRNCFVGSAILGLAVLIAVFVAPAPPPPPVSVADVPERLARLILEKPKPVAPVLPAPEQVTVETPKVEPRPEPAKPKPRVQPRRNTRTPKVARDAGARGRQQATKEVTQNLAQVTGSLDQALGNLSKSLQTSTNDDGKSPRRSRRRSVRSGRSSRQLSTVQGTIAPSSADVSGSAIETKGISITAISDLAIDGGPGENDSDPGSTRGGRAATGRGEYRSNESLLSVVRRYAPGIQFCYDNELKKNPGLRGKLVVSLTVLANGSVSEAFVVEDNLRSPAVTQCVLSQIRGWRFPAIAKGDTSFKTPFVFTPPE